jgi:hypothetical protein
MRYTIGQTTQQGEIYYWQDSLGSCGDYPSDPPYIFSRDELNSIVTKHSNLIDKLDYLIGRGGLRISNVDDQGNVIKMMFRTDFDITIKVKDNPV